MAQIKYPIGMQSFRKIREDGYVYVSIGLLQMENTTS